MRSGVCGQRGSGGNAFSVLALAIPTRSAPSSRARFLTDAASMSIGIVHSRLRIRKPLSHSRQVWPGGAIFSRAEINHGHGLTYLGETAIICAMAFSPLW